MAAIPPSVVALTEDFRLTFWGVFSQGYREINVSPPIILLLPLPPTLSGDAPGCTVSACPNVSQLATTAASVSHLYLCFDRGTGAPRGTGAIMPSRLCQCFHASLLNRFPIPPYFQHIDVLYSSKDEG